ncbi:Bud21p NDAI_0F00420 [Naumovozyma dairenensis CBS 421]|uniref:Uncharacterized protein n=1 Tax=Naumovozyma dairenensis (strain ATCC 10597 / BCRC 20456 / CBS 421 / NBRC 0211 / NRRL Y-12639) TaxID=1071378 RepID=G0WC50_NAUDC|nr:hypothetical protein NDAI_0F00420 [Naumovozyma dairenensis CBS 421]CCD25361.1 hypothetical protein NDAI_0F00420 [Naumovozyma dairenensis CBS 421]
MPKRINFNEIDPSEYSLEIKSEINKRKKKTLKNLKKTIVRKGPVTVSLLSSTNESRSLAPKREVTVMKSKDKWLKRRALNRK